MCIINVFNAISDDIFTFYQREILPVPRAGWPVAVTLRNHPPPWPERHLLPVPAPVSGVRISQGSAAVPAPAARQRR